MMDSTEFLKASSSLQDTASSALHTHIPTDFEHPLPMHLVYLFNQCCIQGRDCPWGMSLRSDAAEDLYMTAPTSVLASHISSRGPPRCRAQHPGGHTALHRCRSCTRSPRLFLHRNDASSPYLSLVKQGRREDCAYSLAADECGSPKAKGAPQPIAHPTAMSAAFPVASCKSRKTIIAFQVECCHPKNQDLPYPCSARLGSLG